MAVIHRDDQISLRCRKQCMPFLFFWYLLKVRVFTGEAPGLSSKLKKFSVNPTSFFIDIVRQLLTEAGSRFETFRYSTRVFAKGWSIFSRIPIPVPATSRNEHLYSSRTKKWTKFLIASSCSLTPAIERNIGINHSMLVILKSFPY